MQRPEIDRGAAWDETVAAVRAGLDAAVDYLTTKAKNGIVSIGLNDWAPYKTETPAEVTSTAYYFRDAQIDLGSWPVWPVFQLIQRQGAVDSQEMYRVFNMGIGMVVIVSKYHVDSVLHLLKRAKQPATVMGEVKAGAKRVVFE